MTDLLLFYLAHTVALVGICWWFSHNRAESRTGAVLAVAGLAGLAGVAT